MAYVFSQLDQAMQPEKVDIFGQQGNSGASPGQSQGQGAGQAGQPPTREAGSESVGAQGTGPAAGAAPAKPLSATPVDQSAVLSKQSSSMPGFVGSTQANQSSIQQNLQNEADAYNQKTLGLYQGFDKTDAGKTALANVETDPTAATAIATRLNQTTAPQAEAFTSHVNLNDPGVQALSSPSLLAQYMKSQGGANYTSGMAGLDQMLLGKNQDFQTARAGILDKQNVLTKQAADEAGPTGLQSRDQATIDTNYGGNTEYLKQLLSGREDAIRGGIDSRVAAENAARSALQTKGFDPTYDEAAAFNAAKMGNIDLQNYFKGPTEEGLDPNQYIKYGGQVGANDMATADDVSRFTNLQHALSGTRGSLTPLTAGGPLSPQATFDRQGYANALAQKARDRMTAAQAAQAAQAATDAAAAANQPPAEAETAQGDLGKVKGAISEIPDIVGAGTKEGARYVGAGDYQQDKVAAWQKAMADAYTANPEAVRDEASRQGSDIYNSGPAQAAGADFKSNVEDKLGNAFGGGFGLTGAPDQFPAMTAALRRRR